MALSQKMRTVNYMIAGLVAFIIVAGYFISHQLFHYAQERNMHYQSQIFQAQFSGSGPARNSYLDSQEDIDKPTAASSSPLVSGREEMIAFTSTISLPMLTVNSCVIVLCMTGIHYCVHLKDEWKKYTLYIPIVQHVPE